MVSDDCLGWDSALGFFQLCSVMERSSGFDNPNLIQPFHILLRHSQRSLFNLYSVVSSLRFALNGN